jgi:hypothetical protein
MNEWSFRLARTAIFAVVIGFAGFAACMPVYRSQMPDHPRKCPPNAKIVSDDCGCPAGTQQIGDRCEAMQKPPQTPPPQ